MRNLYALYYSLVTSIGSSDKLYFRVLRVEGHAAYHQNEKFLFLIESPRIIPFD